MALATDEMGNFQRSSFILSDDDLIAEASLRAKFAAFWSGASDDIRTAYDTFIAETPMAPGISFEEVTEPTVLGWWCRPEKAKADQAILYIHGGCYVLGSARAYRGLASQIARRAETAVFVLEYPLAPEHPMPAALNSARRALTWLAKSGVTELVIVGDSAGGGLSLSLIGAVIKGGDAPLPIAACVTFSPWTDLTLSGASMHDSADVDVLLAKEYLIESVKSYVGTARASDPHASPLFEIPAGMPPLYIQVGTDELLLDDARRYAEAAAKAGGTVQLDIWQGLHHVFQLNVSKLQSSRQALDHAVRFIDTAFQAAHISRFLKRISRECHRFGTRSPLSPS